MQILEAKTVTVLIAKQVLLLKFIDGVLPVVKKASAVLCFPGIIGYAKL